MLLSFLPIYSASATFIGGTSFDWLLKQAMHLTLGLVVLYTIHRLNFKLIGALSVLLQPIMLVLLLFTLYQGREMGGANASRWVNIPFVGMSFQTSAAASLVLLIWIARWLSLPRDYTSFKGLIPVLAQILLTCGLILPADLSTAALLFAMSMLLLFLGQVPLKYLLSIAGLGLAAIALFVLIVLAFPGISNRVDTWKSRIVNYGSANTEASYQADLSKMAIAEGQFLGKGPGKSVAKYTLPQSNSDFVFAIITEEYGLLGASALIFFYLTLFRRMFKLAHRATTKFGTLLVMAASSGMMLQAAVNMGVSSGLLPVTGQTLPLLSAGGSSIWMTCAAFGVVLSVSHGDIEWKNKTVGKEEWDEEPLAEALAPESETAAP